jgi:hypothetical protein
VNVVFLGPTMPVAAARTLCDAVYLPPARRGDLLPALERHRPTTLALIDGYFEQVPAVWHKEVLFALAAGVAVVGAASMGALRAAELQAFGMVGIGRVYEAYASGSFPPFEEPFEDDDEVAVVHGPAEAGYAASDAMVDIRATLARAVDDAVIDLATARELAALAKSLFYKERSYSRMLTLATEIDLAPKAIVALKAWLPEHRVAQKRLDAEELLRRLATGDIDASPPAFRFERTLLWEEATAGRAIGEVL